MSTTPNLPARTRKNAVRRTPGGVVFPNGVPDGTRTIDVHPIEAPKVRVRRRPTRTQIVWAVYNTVLWCAIIYAGAILGSYAAGAISAMP